MVLGMVLGGRIGQFSGEAMLFTPPAILRNRYVLPNRRAALIVVPNKQVSHKEWMREIMLLLLAAKLLNKEVIRIDRARGRAVMSTTTAAEQLRLDPRSTTIQIPLAKHQGILV